MKVLVDIVHPAHVHFFRNPIRLLEQAGHEVLVTSRRKDCTLELLDELGIQHECLTTQNKGSLLSMASELIERNRKLARFARSHKPDVITALGGASAAQVGRWLKIPTVVFYDTETARLQNALTYPFATRIVVPECYRGRLPERKTLRYRGYHELSYLHPDRFSPDWSKAIENGLAAEGDTFFIRLVSWQASHDVGLNGWSRDLLFAVVEQLSRRGHVLISSEGQLPAALEPFRYPGKTAAVHHVLGHCRLYIGESATMASEAVVMGVPAIYAAPSFRGYIREQQDRYQLARFISKPNEEQFISCIHELLGMDPELLRARHRKLMAECVDVAHFIQQAIIGIAVKTGDSAASQIEE